MSVLLYLIGLLAVPVLLLVPGALWLRRLGVSPLVSTYAGGALSVAAVGAVVGLGVVLPVSVPTASRIGAVVFGALTVYCAITAPRPLLPERAERGGLVVFAALYLALGFFMAVPTSPWTPATAWAVLPGRVYTPKWPGAPVDSFLPYRTGQIAYHEIGGDARRDGYTPGWWLSDRTPLLGMQYAWTASLTGVSPPRDDIMARPFEQVRSTTVDNVGYWMFDLTVACIGAASVLALYLLARDLASRRVATGAAALYALMPGIFLYGVYTRPALALTFPALLAVLAARRGHGALAGALVGLSYLLHASGGWWIAPVLVLLVQAARRTAGTEDWKAPAARAAGAAVGLTALLALPWQLFTSFALHASTRFLAWPLGSTLSDPANAGESMRIAWTDWVNHGVGDAIWVRLQALTSSINPVPLAHGDAPLGYNWTELHSLNAWGLCGLVLFPVALWAVVTGRGDLRRLLVSVVVPLAIIGLLFEGHPESFFPQAMLGVLGLLAIPAVELLARMNRRRQAIVLGLVLAESLSFPWASAMLVPPSYVSTAKVAVLVAVVLFGQAVLAATLILSVRPSRAAVPPDSDTEVAGLTAVS